MIARSKEGMTRSKLVPDSGEEGLSLGRKIVLSVAALIATLLFFSAPYPLSLETIWTIPVAVFTVLSLWLALTSRFFAGFALACLAGILSAFYAQAFEVHYLYRFPLKDGRMFQSGAHYAYRSLLRDSQWMALLPATIGASFLALLNVMTVVGRLHHGAPSSARDENGGVLRGLCAAALVGSLVGLFVGWFRYNHGFVVGIQGMISGLALGLITSRFLGRGPENIWTWRRREAVLAIGLAAFLVFELIGIGVGQRFFSPLRWVSGMLNGDLREYVVGFSRYQWRNYLFRPGPVGWMLFNLLDVVFLVFLTLVTMFNRVGNHGEEEKEGEE